MYEVAHDFASGAWSIRSARARHPIRERGGGLAGGKGSGLCLRVIFATDAAEGFDAQDHTKIALRVDWRDLGVAFERCEGGRAISSTNRSLRLLEQRGWIFWRRGYALAFWARSGRR